MTGRELQVLALLAEGGTDKSIGKKLHIAASTAHFHTLRAMKKLGAKTRTHAVACALRKGIIQ
jgi:DNA-binding NarL/FixJ family response regulator